MIEIRMAKLEGAYEQINERLGSLEQRFASELSSLRSETTLAMTSLRSEMRAGISELHKQISAQFYWLLTLVLGSILIPILRDLAR